MAAIRWMALVPLVGLLLVPFIVETRPARAPASGALEPPS